MGYITEQDFDAAGGRYIGEDELDPPQAEAPQPFGELGPMLDLGEEEKLVPAPPPRMPATYPMFGPEPVKDPYDPFHIPQTEESMKRERFLREEGWTKPEIARLESIRFQSDIKKGARRYDEIGKQLKPVQERLGALAQKRGLSPELYKEATSLFNQQKTLIDEADSLRAWFEKVRDVNAGYESSIVDSIPEIAVKSFGVAFARVMQGLSGVVGMVEELVPEDGGLGRKSMAMESSKAWKDLAEEIAPWTNEGTWQYYTSKGLETALMQIPMLMAAAATGNVALALAPMGVISAGSSYGEFRQGNPEANRALTALAAIGQGVAEAGSEMIPIKAFLAPGKSVALRTLRAMVPEIAQEELMTIYEAIQSYNITSPEMTMGDVFKNMKEAAIVTALAVPIMAGAVHPIVKAQQAKIDKESSGRKKAIEEAIQKYESTMNEVRATWPEMSRAQFETELKLLVDSRNFTEDGQRREKPPEEAAVIDLFDAAIQQGPQLSDQRMQMLADRLGVRLEKEVSVEQSVEQYEQGEITADDLVTQTADQLGKVEEVKPYEQPGQPEEVYVQAIEEGHDIPDEILGDLQHPLIPFNRAVKDKLITRFDHAAAVGINSLQKALGLPLDMVLDLEATEVDGPGGKKYKTFMPLKDIDPATPEGAAQVRELAQFTGKTEQEVIDDINNPEVPGYRIKAVYQPRSLVSDREGRPARARY